MPTEGTQRAWFAWDVTKFKLGNVPFCFPPFQEVYKHMLTIIGNPQNAAGQTLADYLATTDYDPTRIAVERNGDIVPKAQYGETTLADGDVVEVVSFVGGG